MLEKFVKKYRVDLILLALIAIFLIVTNISMYSEMKQLPSPLYGGDYYYQQGCINHIRYGGSAAANCNLLSSTPGYFPFYGLLVAKTANILNMESMNAIFFFSNIVILLSVILVYVLLRKIFDSPYMAALGVMLLYATQTIIVKYTIFGRLVMTPLFLLCLYMFYKDQSYRNAIYLAISMGLANITHSIYLPVTYFIFGMFCLFILNKKSFRKIETKYIKKNLQRVAILFCIVFAISFVISLFYWSDPLLKMGKTSPHYLQWNGPGDFTKKTMQIDTLVGIIKDLFFNFVSFRTFTSLLCLAGLFFVFSLKKHSEESKFIMLTGASMLLIAFSYFITIPLLGIHFVPNYIISVFALVPLMFALYALSILIKLFSSNYKEYANYVGYVLLVFALIIAFLHVQKVDVHKNSQWYKVGLNSLDPAKTQMQDFILKNTDVNDVILTTKEVGFAVNALTGRKLVVSRRAQNDAFEDMDPRELDAAVILYGSNDDLRKELIKKYNIKYLYWDYYWVQSEFQLNQQGQVVGAFDPLIAFYDINKAEYLEENNVSYIVQNTYVDPTLRSKNHPRYDLIMISPDNYINATHPWSLDIDPMLTEIWSFSSGGQKIAILYALNQ